jgi:flagellar hook-basal body complex protein FliE
MNIDAISQSLLNLTPLSTEQKPEASFTQWLSTQVLNTNESLINADEALSALARGNAPSLHQTMLTLEEAKLSFQFMEQIRNRLMGAWQELLREQI